MTALVPADLAQAIEREHYAAITAVKDALGHAIRCGELLAQAKAAVEHGEWLPWIEANLPFGDRQARKYMRLAANSEQIGIENSDFTIDGALAALATPRPPPPERPQPEPDQPYSSDSIFSQTFDGSFVPPQETAAELVARIAAPVEPDRPKQALSAPQRMRHQWNALQKERAQQQGEQKPQAAAPDWRVGVDPCRKAYLTAACELSRERRIKECEHVMRALGLPTADWTRIYLPKPEAGAKWPDDGSLIRQGREWAAFLLDNNHASPNAVQQMGLALMELGRARIGAPVASQTGEPEAITAGPPGELTVPTALATENMDALRERLDQLLPEPLEAVRARETEQRSAVLDALDQIAGETE
jgi:hypothetical protein